jgi:hypothetical protein
VSERGRHCCATRACSRPDEDLASHYSTVSLFTLAPSDPRRASASAARGRAAALARASVGATAPTKRCASTQSPAGRSAAQVPCPRARCQQASSGCRGLPHAPSVFWSILRGRSRAKSFA